MLHAVECSWLVLALDCLLVSGPRGRGAIGDEPGAAPVTPVLRGLFLCNDCSIGSPDVENLNYANYCAGILGDLDSHMSSPSLPTAAAAPL